jgi:predicted alpha/beta hydrolase family esterase
MLRKQNIFFSALLIHLSFLLSGCVSEGREGDEIKIAADSGLIRDNLRTRQFTVVSWSRITPPVNSLRVYIEGDGFAWKSRTQPSGNPTPHNPVALKLAASDTKSNVLYLARPCQFLNTPLPAGCGVNWWTNDRFSPVVIEAMNEALEQIVSKYPGVSLELVGYSGGGNVAALLAERRKDVRALRTVAGNLDVAFVNAQHKVTPMPNALSAIDRAATLRHLPQTHFSGEEDTTVPPAVAARFQQAVGGDCVRVERVAGMAHGSDWASIWPQLLAKGVPAC